MSEKTCMLCACVDCCTVKPEECKLNVLFTNDQVVDEDKP